MNDYELRALLSLFMVSDPWPVESWDQEILENLLDTEAGTRGYSNWVEAYHRFEV